MNRRFSRILLLTFFDKIVIHDGWEATLICTFVRPSLNCLTHCCTFPSLITLGPYASYNCWWSSAAVWFFAFKNHITAWISQLVGFILNWHKMMIHKEVETEISGFTVNYWNSLCKHTPHHITPMTATHDWPLLLTAPCLYVTSVIHLLMSSYSIGLCHILRLYQPKYEGWNFNFGNAAVTFDTAHLQSSYFHRPLMYSPELCRTRSQQWGSRMMPLAVPVLLMVRTERSTAEGLNPPCNCPIR